MSTIKLYRERDAVVYRKNRQALEMKREIEELLKNKEFTEGTYWHRKQFPANAEIVKQGDTSKNFYLIKQGCVRVLGRVDIGDQRQVSPGVCDLSDGEVFGELVLFDDEPRSASVVAISDCDIIEIEGDQMMHFLLERPELGFEFLRALMTMMVQRLRHTNQKIFSLFAWGLKAHSIDQHM